MLNNIEPSPSPSPDEGVECIEGCPWVVEEEEGECNICHPVVDFSFLTEKVRAV